MPEAAYVRAGEWKDLHGPKVSSGQKHTRLPFNFCCLGLSPLENPVMTVDEGHAFLFSFMNIVPFIRKHGYHPITGKTMTTSELIKVHFSETNGEYSCPVTGRVFNDNSRIVAIKVTGNVFSWEAVEEFNIKAKSMKDLLTEEPFTLSDIVILSDPTNPEWLKAHNTTLFSPSTSKTSQSDPNSSTTSKSGVRLSSSAKLALDELAKKEIKPINPPGMRDSSSKISSTSSGMGFMSTGASTSASVSAGTTSFDLKARSNRIKQLSPRPVVTFHTSLGRIEITLDCKAAPKTCENMIILAKRGYYNNTKSHRLIKNFMVQLGDPTGTGRGGESAWGAPFEDEPGSAGGHARRGTVSMANSGPNTNGSQFFITFKDNITHLDGKHTVFGFVTGGMDVLAAVESLPVDKADRPVVDFVIHKVEVSEDPYAAIDEIIRREKLKNQSISSAEYVPGSTYTKIASSAASSLPVLSKEEEEEKSKIKSLSAILRNIDSESSTGVANSPIPVGRYFKQGSNTEPDLNEQKFLSAFEDIQSTLSEGASQAQKRSLDVKSSSSSKLRKFSNF